MNKSSDIHLDESRYLAGRGVKASVSGDRFISLYDVVVVVVVVVFTLKAVPVST